MNKSKPRKAAYLQITRECNNECIFCSNPQFKKEYSLTEIKKRIIGFKNDGITEIMLTGGEPTLVDSLAIIIKFIRENEITPKMITNGVELSNINLTKTLFDAGLTDINVSIHSNKEGMADKLSQKRGHFKKAISGTRNALNVGMHVSINSTINSMNCRKISDMIEFFIRTFPNINHYVFNNLDPGKADGELKSRTAQNPWIVARFIDMELELKKTVELLKRFKKTFRIERMPLCYMQGFEEFSTETRKIVKDEQYICSFISKNKRNEVRRVNPKDFRVKVECCSHCLLDEICAGVQKEYIDIYGGKELFPVFAEPVSIIKKIIGARL